MKVLLYSISYTIIILTAPNYKSQRHSSKDLGRLAEMGRNKRSGHYAWEIEDYQDLRPFLTMLSHGDYFEKQDAAYVLRCFFMKKNDIQETVPAQLLENLIPLLSDTNCSENVSEKFAATLGMLAMSPKNSSGIARLGGIKSLVDMLREGLHRHADRYISPAMEQAAAALAFLSIRKENQIEMFLCGAWEPLSDMKWRGRYKASYFAKYALAEMSLHEEVLKHIRPNFIKKHDLEHARRHPDRIC